MFEIHVYPTHISISNGHEAFMKLEKLIEMFEYEDEYEEVIKKLGYVLRDDNDTLYFNKGVDIDYLRRTLGNAKIINHQPSESEDMIFEYEEIIPPRDEEQVEMINFVAAEAEWAKSKDQSQIFTIAKTGVGKTFTSCVGAATYRKKTLVICHRSELLKQWRSTFIEKVGMDDSDIHTLTTEDFLAAEQLQLDLGDVYLLSHQTFRFALKAMDGDFERIAKAIENLGIGLKIIDEAHLEFHNIILIDMAMNVKRNLYLTATDGRSSKEEDRIFKYVFTKALKFTKSAKHDKKWIEYCSIFINTHVPFQVVKYQLENGRGMNATKYGKAVIQRDRQKTHFHTINELLRLIFTKDQHAKVLIFMPLIDLCDELEFFINTNLNKDPSFDYDLRIGTINSHNTKSENDYSAKCDVIISTILSCGTGKDIPGLTDIICCSPFKSSITCQQVLGRLRYYGKNCGYWDIIDESVKMDMIFAKLRSKTIKKIALSMSSMQFAIF